jgi:hypothetical protein
MRFGCVFGPWVSSGICSRVVAVDSYRIKVELKFLILSGFTLLKFQCLVEI